ncbi:MAG: lysozyme [Candidatus Caenarcaniphilales bacterium]|nr:lysozyme [Candidatus Caenarcaniphilales bacterium]
MKTSKKGIKLLKDFEGYRAKAYLCSAGVWTIGYGTTKYKNGRAVKSGDQIDQNQAEELLANDLLKFEKAVLSAVKVKLNQNQFDALLCFVYNIGSGAFKSSTLLKRVNEKNFTDAANEFLRWNKAVSPQTGKLRVLPGLTRRREAEKKLFASKAGVNSSTSRSNTSENTNKTPKQGSKISLEELRTSLIDNKNHQINKKVKESISKEAKKYMNSKDFTNFEAYLTGLADGLKLAKELS